MLALSVDRAPPTRPRLRSVCVEGWRGVSHSIAMVNQYQLLELLRLPGLRVTHRDVPFFMPHWNAGQVGAGFDPAERERIDAVPPPGDAPVDCVLRIASPTPADVPDGVKAVTFMVTEFGLTDKSFQADPRPLGRYTHGDNRIVTPSAWARERIAEFGFDAERISVVPHGVKGDLFQPLDDEARARARRSLSFGDDETVFLNVGVATWNKGIDLAIVAFARLRQGGAPVRLILKDHKGLYGIGIERTLAEVAASHPGLLDETVLGAITLIQNSLSLAQMRTLYAVADAYVSPYRAEGFNMPVLEAMACGTHAIVTAGGATDDFCPAELSTRVASRSRRAGEMPQVTGQFRVPDDEALLAAMRGRVGHARRDAAAEARRVRLHEEMSWAAVTRRLAALL